MFLGAFLCLQAYFYPRSPCGERHTKGNNLSYYFRISIHALLAESDLAGKKLVKTDTGISIHALLAESDRINRHITNG